MGVKITIKGVEANGGKILTGTVIKGDPAHIKIENVKVENGAEILSGTSFEKNKAGVDITVVGDGKSVVVDWNDSNKDDKIEVDNSPKKTEKKRGLLKILFGNGKKQEEKDVGNTSHNPSIQDRVSGNGKFRDPRYSQADTGVGSQGAAEQDKGHMR